MCWRRVYRVVQLSCHQDKMTLMQLWMESNVVMLHNVVETMPRRMHAIIKAKGGWMKYWLFFLVQAVCVQHSKTDQFYTIWELYLNHLEPGVSAFMLQGISWMPLLHIIIVTSGIACVNPSWCCVLLVCMFLPFSLLYFFFPCGFHNLSFYLLQKRNKYI